MTKKVFLLVFAVITLFSASIYADTRPLPMNRIQLTLVKEQWAKTSTAKVVVNLAAVLNQKGLAATHKSIYNKLNGISRKGEWHITGFNRYKDSSGLEKLNVTAEARLPESELPSLRQRAEQVSQSGTKFTIGAIEFKPSMADMQATRAEVRHAIYEQANTELARINKVYSGQQAFFIHSINFLPERPIPQPRLMKQRTMVMAQESVAQDSSALVISDKVTMSALVMYAAKN